MKNEITGTDQFVRREIEKFGIPYSEQSALNPEISKALKGASKQGGKGIGKPEFVIQNGEYLIVIEDKKSNDKLIKYNEANKIDKEISSLKNYAVNGAVHYARHIIEKTSSFDEVIAVGITGDEGYHNIQPVVVSKIEDTISEKVLPKISNLDKLNPENIAEWYSINILKEAPREQKEIFELQSLAKEIHEDLRNYASLEDENKSTVISAILLALSEKTFNVANLTGDDFKKDGDIIFEAVKTNISRRGAMPQSKTTILLNKFSFLTTNVKINEINLSLGMTPLKFLANKLKDKVLHHFGKNTNYDMLGNFYGAFVKYGGNDSNSLGIVLTPHHITTLMTELIDVISSDYVLDPACGSGAFLISAMNKMVAQARGDEEKIKHIKKHQLLGIEMQEKLFTVATTNMILRGDGKSNLQHADMFSISGESMRKKKVNKILFNPPYSQGKTDKTLTEISFINHALDMLVTGGKLAVIVPQSTMVGKSKEEKEYKKKILEKNTLELVITLNKDTFHGVGTNPVIAIFEGGRPHPENKKVKFINFEDDGFILRKHVGLVDDGSADEKRKFLFDVINGDVEDYTTQFMVKSTIKADDEWLHSFFYFNDAIPSEADFEKTIADYLTFQFDMYTHGRGYLFEGGDDE
jgi:type I restriction enzyme M protein